MALASIDGRAPLDHDRVYDFCVGYYGPALHSLGFGKSDRIALVLPNGPELALAIFATCHWASCVPLSANGAVSELESDLLRCGASLVIGPYSGRMAPASSPVNGGVHHRGGTTTTTTTTGGGGGWDKGDGGGIVDQSLDRFNIMSSSNAVRDWSAFRTIEECAHKVGIPFVGLVPSPFESGIFTLQATRLSHPFRYGEEETDMPPTRRRTYEPPTILPTLLRSFSPRTSARHADAANREGMERRTTSRDDGTMVSTEPNAANDEVLVLFTSGTTGSKKLVPHVMGDMLTAAATIALSWNLRPNDVNCNLMPLFHVGGIVRQVFSPIISGGCVICCPSFDPSVFWALLARGAFTWYYAAPTMHQLILQTGKSDGMIGNGGECHLKLRMIANAAGGLLPSLAKEMLQVFDATVSGPPASSSSFHERSITTIP